MSDINNADSPANPTLAYTPAAYEGLSKRELFCLHNGVPDTGDEELDQIIREGNIRKTVHLFVAGAANTTPNCYAVSDSAKDHLRAALRIDGYVEKLLEQGKKNASKV